MGFTGSQISFRTNIPTTVTIGGRGRACRALSLSRTGALLAGRLPRPEEDTLHLTLKPPWPALEVSADARIVRIAGRVPGILRLSVQFVGLDTASRDRLERLVSRIVEGRSALEVAGLPRHARPRELRRALERIPLGHRIQLASRADVADRRILIHDPSPAVLDSLARNPNLQSREVRKLLSLPLVPPSTLKVLGNTPRWSDDLKIRIACHPRTPASTAAKLVENLSPPLLRRVAENPGCPTSLRPKILRRIDAAAR